MYVDKSMDAAKRAQRQEELDTEHRKEAIARACNTFDDCVASVRELQTSLAARQKEMAIIAVQKYATLCIQNAFRAHQARRFRKMKAAARLISTWVMVRRLHTKKQRAAKAIGRAAIRYRQRVHAKYIMLLARSARRLQAQVHALLQAKREGILNQIHKYAIGRRDLYLLHGSVRAARCILLNALPPDVRAMRTNETLLRLVRTYKRRRRMRL